MRRTQASDINRRSMRSAGRPRSMDVQLHAYFAARETMRRLLRSPNPCFARDWQPDLRQPLKNDSGVMSRAVV